MKLPKLSLLQLKHKVFVLEIGEEYLKMVGTEEKGFVRKAVYVSQEPIRDLSEVEISQKILAFLKDNSFKPQRTILSHPAHTLTTRILSLPSKDPDEIRNILELQAVKQTPYSRDEITIGFKVLETDEKGYSKVLLVIAQCDITSRYYRIAEMAGCRSDHITLSFDGVKRWFDLVEKPSEISKDDTVMLLNVDGATTDFLILQSDRLLFERSLTYGARQLTTKDAMENQFLSEIQRTLESVRSEHSGLNVTKVVVTGMRQSAMDDLGEVIRRNLNVETIPLPILGGLKKKISKDFEKTAEALPTSFASILGYALDSAPIDIDLIPPEILMRQEIENRAKDLTVFGVLVLILVMLMSGVVIEKLYKKTSYVDELKNQYEAIKEEALSIERLVAKMKLAKEQMNLSKNFLDVLYDVNDILPNNIYLTSLQYNAPDSEVVIRGVSEDMSSVFQFLSTLEAAQHLEMVKTRNVTKRRIADRDVSEFEIVANLEGAMAGEEQ